MSAETADTGSIATLFSREFWGISRHELIAGAAEEFLTARAREAVARITAPLGDGVSLTELAAWADQIKRRAPDPEKDDPDTVAFLRDTRNEGQPNWHFVNLPVGAERYDRERYPAFTRDDDIVQIIGLAVRTLTGATDRFSPLNALRLVVHLVGDVHQPVHVGCGYIRRSDDGARLELSPEVAAAEHLPSDRGGNSLLLPIGSKGVSLHAYWDSRIGGADLHEPTGEADAIDPGARREQSAKLARMIREEETGSDDAPALDAPVPLGRWAEAWANQALEAAREAYRSLEIDRPVESGSRSYILRWDGKDSYDARCAPLARRQLTAAGRNLSALLNGILR